MKSLIPSKPRAPAKVVSRPSRSTSAIVLALAALLSLLITRSAAAQQADRTLPDTTSAWLQDMRLVFSASRYAQDVREAPASVTIISAAEIRRYGYRTLADVLGAARGIFTHNDRAYDYVTVRGIARQSDYNTRVQVLLDGHRVNDAATDAAGIGTDALLDLDLVDHIEIIHGPGSALFGTSAFFGVVNIVTTRGRNLTGLRGSAEAASFGTYRGALSWGGRSGSHELLVAGSLEDRRGRDLYFAEYRDSANGGMATALDGYRAYRGFVKAALGDLSFNAGFSYRDRGVPTGAYGVTFNDPRSGIRDQVGSATLSYERPFEDLSRIALTAAYDMYGYDGDYPYAHSLFHDYNRSHTVSFEGRYLRFFPGGSKLTMGARLNRVADADLGAYDVDPKVTFVRLDQSHNTSAAYGQLEWRLGSKLISYTGVRHDHYPSFGGTTNPRTSLVYQPFAGTWLKAHYGRAFRAPNLYELYYEDGGVTQKPPTALEPERVTTAEVSLDQNLWLGLRASVAAYQVRTKGLINLVTDSLDGTLVYVNESGPRSRGVEVELERSSRNGVEGRVSYAHQHASDADGNALVNSPSDLVRAGVSLPLRLPQSRVALELRHVARRLTLNGSHAPSYTLTNVTFTALGVGGTEILAQVRNAFGVRYVDPAGAEHLQNVIAGDRREFRLGVKRAF